MQWLVVVTLSAIAFTASPTHASSVDELIAVGSQIALSALTGWMLLLGAALLLSRLPATAGHVGRALGRRLLPAAIHGAVGLAAAATLAVPATADSAVPPFTIDRVPSVATVEPALPSGPTPPPTPVPTAGAERSGRVADRPGVGDARPVHVVVPGDSLWRIAAAALPPEATAAQIDRSWRAWWRLNIDVIGADPDLLLVGQRLQPPTPAAVDSTASTTARY